MRPIVHFLKKNYLALLLMVETLIYWRLSSLMNPYAMALLFLLAVDLVWRNTIYSQLLSGFFFLLAAYLFLALFSELHEFQSFNKDAVILLVFGTSYLGSVIAISSFRIYKIQENN